MTSKTNVYLISAFAAALLAVLWIFLGNPRSTYSATGTIVGFGSDEKTVFIAHGDVPGLMPAMTMPFTVTDGELLQQFDVQDSISFEIRIENNETHAGDLVLLRSGEESESRLHAGRGPTVGDTLPSVVLIDHDGDPLLPGNQDVSATVLTFIYTRCPLPDYCPLMSSRFQELQATVVARYPSQVRLLSISFDPEFDTPEVLRDYARRYTRDTQSWRFATGDAEQIRRITNFFGVTYEADGQLFDHNLTTAIVDSSGTVYALWHGNDWEAKDVYHRVEQLLEGAHEHPVE